MTLIYFPPTPPLAQWRGPSLCGDKTVRSHSSRAVSVGPHMDPRRWRLREFLHAMRCWNDWSRRFEWADLQNPLRGTQLQSSAPDWSFDVPVIAPPGALIF